MIYKDCILCEKGDYRLVYPATQNDTQLDPYRCTCTNLGHGRFCQIVRCRHCGLTYSTPRYPDSEIINNYKKVVDEIYFSEKDYRKITFKKALKLIEKYKTSGAILDIGCYIGIFLEVAREAGWKVFGLEPSQWAAKYAREELKLQVLEGITEEAFKFGVTFDVVTLWDTIEHMTDPLNDLIRIRQLLNDKGFLFISTMNMDSFFARVSGKRWPWLMDMHLYYFTPRTISLLLEKAGFRVHKIRLFSYTVSLNYLSYKLLSVNKFLSQVVGKVLTILNIGQLPINIQLGDAMVVIAQKKNV